MKTSEARASFPAWLPDDARLYLTHIETGASIRALARREGCHASTVLRKVRSFENRRDDPLVDEGLDRIGRVLAAACKRGTSDLSSFPSQPGANRPMTLHSRASAEIITPVVDDATVELEARRILRRLCEAGAVLAIAAELPKAVVLKGEVRMAVVDRAVAQVFAIKDWIHVVRTGRATAYAITPAGRAAVRRLLSADAKDEARRGGAIGASHDIGGFADQHRDWEERTISESGGPRRMRFNMAESPMGALARRRDKDGQPFLSAEMVAAGERLREDFELAQMGPKVAQNWDRFLTGAERGAVQPAGPATGGSAVARDRVAAALSDLGPGLGDMVLRCCCFLEGLEVAEKRLGWSARSGKIVLRIALTRLARHYAETYGKYGPKIG